MDKYQKLKAVEGLVRSLDEQYYRMDQNKNATKEDYKLVTDKYYKAILDFLQKEENEKDREDTSIPEVTDMPSNGEPHTRG